MSKEEIEIYKKVLIKILNQSFTIQLLVREYCSKEQWAFLVKNLQFEVLVSEK